MLIRFMVENFLSFKDQQIFSMAAGKHTRHRSHLYSVNGKRLLKGGVIYGANASGKSNLIKAIQFGKEIALNGLKVSRTHNQYFRIDPESNSKPGVFQYDFISNGHIYSYGIAFSYLENVILEEWLYQIDDKEICIFERSAGETMVTDVTFTNPENEQRFYIYAKDVQDNNSFLSTIIHLNLSDTKDFSPFFDVFDWFNSLYFIFPESEARLSQYISNDSLSSAGSLLKHFDTGIESIDGVEMPMEKALEFLPNQVKESLMQNLIEDFQKVRKGKKAKAIEVTIGKNRFVFTLKNNDIIATKLGMNHGNNDDLFDFEDESDGTRRLFNLIPIYKIGKQNCIILIDELDRSFHTGLTKEFIQKFYEKTNECPSQLISTLHDANIMDLELLRQDEIWFVERQDDHSSKVYSLNKFKERFDKVISKEYLLGRYGAIPCFNEMWDEDEEEV